MVITEVGEPNPTRSSGTDVPESGGSAPQPTGDTAGGSASVSVQESGEGPESSPPGERGHPPRQDNGTGPSSDNAGGAVASSPTSNAVSAPAAAPPGEGASGMGRKVNDVGGDDENKADVGIDHPNQEFEGSPASKGGNRRDGRSLTVGAAGPASTPREDGRSKGTPTGASKVPVRSASMGPQSSQSSQPSKGTAAAGGGTRQGRWSFKNQMKCGFCGGKLCLRCSEQCALRCKGAAVNGLHSHWVTDSIIGMQRPSSRLIRAYDIVGQFKRKGVTAIFNLTEPGEHPHCGDGLEKSSGFPYLPETFMREGISVYNFAWEDMTTPSMSVLADIVRVAASSLRVGGKIAVHCHAGYGRTGLVIASILVMLRNLPAQQAVALVRDKRPGSVQTNAQVAMVVEFANFVRGVRVVYHFTDHARVTLGQHLAQQAFLLHGQESVHLRWLPKSVALAARMLVALAREKPAAVVLALAGVEDSSTCIGMDEAKNNKSEGALDVWGMAEEQRLKMMQYASNANDWEQWEHLAEQCDAKPAPVDPRIPAQLLYEWLDQLAVPPIAVTELRRALPLSAISSASPPEELEATFKTMTTSDTATEGSFGRLNLLPVGQVRLLQCLTECLRSVREALAAAGIPEGTAYQKGCLRVAIALVHLDKVHEGLLVGRNIAPDAVQALSPPSSPVSGRKQHAPQTPGASSRLGGSSLTADLRLCSCAMEVLVREWKAPLRCRPYSKLEALSNQPEVHGGNEEYWHQKRRSVVPPKDLVQGGRAEGSKGLEQTSTHNTTGHTISVCTINSTDTFSSWGAQDDTAVIKASMEASMAASAAKRESLRRRSLQCMRRRKMPPARPPSTSTGEGPRERWGAMFRVTAFCVLISVGVVTILPRVAGGAGGSRAATETAAPSALFADVKVPADVVPVSIGRPIGSVAGSTLDAQVFMCSLDRNTYFHQPYKYPMFKDLVKLSGGCTGELSTVTSISQLQSEIDKNPDGYLEPTGFVFHMSRCGSTLTANLMGASPHNLVYSESKPPTSLMGLCDQMRCTEEQRVGALRTVIRAMGKTSFHKHMFFKFQSSQTHLIPYYRKAFPNTPWVFVYRNPVPVMMSLLGFKGGVLQHAASPSTPCLRSKRAPPAETARLLDMTQKEAKHASDEQYCAAHLATLVESALSSVDEAAASHEAGGHAVDYDMLPNAIVPVMADLFKAPLSKEEEYYAYEISSWYAKSRGEVYNFSPDTKAKEDRASPAVEAAAGTILEPLYSRLHAVSVAKDSIPAELAAGFTPPHRDRRSAQDQAATTPEISDEEFYATPVHLRGLDRVVDPLAPSFMASSKYSSMPMEAFDCPDVPPHDYPKGYPAMDVINHWNPDDAEQVPPKHYLSTCRFDFQREYEKAAAYSRAEKPFILYNIPSVDATVGRWSSPDYMEKIFGSKTQYATEHSTDNHFMYYNHRLAKQAQNGKHTELNLTDWKPPTDSVNLTYRQWLDLALKHGKGAGEHWYFRVGDSNNKVILKEMEIFQKPKDGKGNIFLVEPRGQRGIHCRFGMPGVIAEAHFDGSRNMVAMISGVRRWIMAHPNQCETMYLLPNGHPSGRHSDVDWSHPDLEKFPDFPQTLISEVLLKAGEVLYVPTQWFHYISNIGVNAQCNSRSGITMDYDRDLGKCGFGSSHSSPRKKSKLKKPIGHRRLFDELDEP
eukprot:g7051.t1